MNARLLSQIWNQLLVFYLENAEKHLRINLLVECSMSSFPESPESPSLAGGKEGFVVELP